MTKNENVITSFLTHLDEYGIRYVSWKNNHELLQVFDGDKDLDIALLGCAEDAFRITAVKTGWLEMLNPVAEFEGIRHYYKVGDNSVVYHLHVYFEIVTGESWLKEFSLPLEDYLFRNREWSIEHQIWILNARAQSYIFLLRHLLKCSSLTSRLLYYKELCSYEVEWKSCDSELGEVCDDGPFNLTPWVASSGLNESFRLPSRSAAKECRASLRQFQRFPTWMLPWYRAYVFWIRLSNKLIFKKKKKFVARGMIVSITGVDGSGKSTVVKELQKVFSSFMSCSLLTLGKPQGPILERARKFVRRDKARNNSSTSRQIQNSSTVANVTACVLAFLRLRTAKKAVRRASKGELVITDRWPTNDRYKMDGPKIISDSSLGTVQAFLSRFEKYLYNKIPSSDVCIVLGVDTDTAVSRNNLRIKEEKETEEEILDRHRVNHHFRPIAHTVLHFDNSASLDLAFPEVLQLVWSKIVESEQSRVVK